MLSVSGGKLSAESSSAAFSSAAPLTTGRLLLVLIRLPVSRFARSAAR